MAVSAAGSHEQSKTLSGRDLYRLLASGLSRLETAVDAINAINVFPVPDRDTGTNMFATLRKTLPANEPTEEESLGSVAALISDRALCGARGNSGVLFAEFLRGFADELGAGEEVGARRLVRAFRRGAIAARAAVQSVVEGTILTVMNDAAAGAERAGGRGADLDRVLQAAEEAARDSLRATPRLLPVLSESRVVDAGAAGFVAVLDGMVLALGGEAAPLDLEGLANGAAPQPPSTQPRDAGSPGEAGVYGYCTELLVRSEAAALDEKRLIERLRPLGGSLLVIGTRRLLRVHIHAADPGAVLSECLEHGSIEEVGIRNMDTQARSEEVEEPREQVGVVAVADGKGFAEIFRSLGAEVVESADCDGRSLEQTLLECVAALPHRAIILLPNSREAIVEIQGIVDWRGKQVRPVETTTMPAGVAALIEVDPLVSFEDNLHRMSAAAAGVRTIGIDYEGGQYLLTLGGSTLGRSNDLARLVQAVIESIRGDFELATVYFSADAEQQQIDELAGAIRTSVPRVEPHFGGQGSPRYLVSLE